MWDQSTHKEFFGRGIVIELLKSVSYAFLQLKFNDRINRRTFICLVL